MRYPGDATERAYLNACSGLGAQCLFVSRVAPMSDSGLMGPTLKVGHPSQQPGFLPSGMRSSPVLQVPIGRDLSYGLGKMPEYSCWIEIMVFGL